MKIKFNTFFLVTLILYIGGGCKAVKSSINKEKKDPKPLVSVVINSASNGVDKIFVPVDGFSWDELAAIAARRSADSHLTALQIKRSYLQNRLDRAWRDPQLRLNSAQTSEDEYNPGGNNGHEESDSYGASLRFYISNPFVNHWIKQQTGINAGSITAQTDELAYAVYCETRMKCCEAAIIEDKLNQLKQAFEQQKKICVRYKQLQQSGYAVPLKIIKAELKSARTEQQIAVREREHRNALFQIAVLTALPIDKIQVRSIDQQVIPEPAAYHADDLIISAVNLRPDLEKIRCEIALAKSGYEIAKARQIPWFEFLEGGYRNRNKDSTTYRATAPDYSDSDQDEWSLRVAIGLPIFSWAGHETALARTTLNEVERRESLAFIAIHNEIKNALENYTEACVSRTKMETNVNERMRTFQSAIKELDSSKTVVETEIMETEEQLNAYQRETRQTLYDCLKLKLYLESVTALKTTR